MPPLSPHLRLAAGPAPDAGLFIWRLRVGDIRGLNPSPPPCRPWPQNNVTAALGGCCTTAAMSKRMLDSWGTHGMNHSGSCRHTEVVYDHATCRMHQQQDTKDRCHVVHVPQVLKPSLVLPKPGSL
jgi:hypothetical protein